jgi:phosphoribosyl 1,2-cyclic phosphate phosphodiesterase
LIITVLGTGTSTGVPMIACHCEVCSSLNLKDKRLRSSVMIEDNGLRVIIDAGPDFRQQMLRENIDRIDAIVITHAHKDHVGGLDEIRAFNVFQKTPIDVYATTEVQEKIKIEFYYAFGKKQYPGIPQMNLKTIDENPFNIAHLKFIPIKVMHLNMPVLGFRIGDFSYITDANFIEPTELDKVKGSRIVMLDALRKKKHISHFTLDEAIAIAGEIHPEKTYFTHISHQLGLHDEVETSLPKNMHLGYDGLKFTI